MWGLGERFSKIMDDEAILYMEYTATWNVEE